MAPPHEALLSHDSSTRIAAHDVRSEPQKITKGNKVLEMIGTWETKLLAFERDFDEKLSGRMKAGVLLNMMPGDLQNSPIQQADKLEHFKMTKEKVVSIMEAKNALHPDAMDADNVNYESYDNTDQDDGEEEDLGAVHRDSLCNRFGCKGHFARNCGTLDTRGKGKGKDKGKDGKGGSQKHAKGSSRDPIVCQYCNKKGHTAKECWKKEREENRDRSANIVDQDARNVDCMGFDMASLEVEEEVAPRTQDRQIVKLRGSYSRRARDVPSCNHRRDHQRSFRYSLLMLSFCPPGLCHPIQEKDEDGDGGSDDGGQCGRRKKELWQDHDRFGCSRKRESTRLPPRNSSTAFSRITARSLLHRS